MPKAVVKSINLKWTDNTMANIKWTDNTMANIKWTDNTMAKINLNGTFFASKIKKKSSSFQICAKKNVGAYLCPSPF
jgi:uncharacterized secreted protein with C-terminal beta-propeller domain